MIQSTDVNGPPKTSKGSLRLKPMLENIRAANEDCSRRIPCPHPLNFTSASLREIARHPVVICPTPSMKLRLFAARCIMDSSELRAGDEDANRSGSPVVSFDFYIKARDRGVG